MVIKALIPVRAGSQRVKNKNIKPFAGSNLLEIKIKQMQRIKKLDGIIVNSDSEEMLSIAKSLGAEAIKRDAYFASNDVPITEVYADLAKNCNAETILFADVTNPLISDNTINNAIDIYFSNINLYDSVNTVNSVKMFLWQNGKSLNYTEENKPRSQDLPDIVAINSAINVLSRDLMINKKSFVGYKPYLLKVDNIEGLDIDNQIDFEFAEFIYNKQKGN